MRTTRLGVCVCLAVVAPVLAQPPFYGEIVTWGAGGGLAGAPTGPFVRIAAGPTHALAMRADGSVAGWGQNQHGQATAPPGQFIDISAGGTGTDGRSFGIRPNGTPEMWGLTTGFPPPPSGTFTTIRAKYDYAILIRADGTLAYWGPPSPLSSVPSGTFTDAAPGLSHVVAIRADGTLEAWGDNTFGQLNVPPDSDFVSVASGAAHSLAVRPGFSGSFFAWGRDNAGQTTGWAPNMFARRVAARDDWSIALASNIVTVGNDPEPGPPEWRFRAVEAGETFGLALMGCFADCDSSTILTVADFGCFRTVFIQGNLAYLDCNGDQLLTIAEFGCFQTRFVLDMGQNCGP